MTQLSPPSRADLDGKPISAAGSRPALRTTGRRTGLRTVDELTITVVLATMPLTYVSVEFGGLQLSGWAWPASLAVALVAVVTAPLNRRALGHLAPYLLFLAVGLTSLLYTPVFSEGVQTLAQMAAPALAYLVAFRTPLSDRMRVRALRLLAFSFGTMVALLFIVGLPREGSSPIQYTGLTESAWVSTRPLSINMIATFLLVNALARSRRAVVGAGGLGLLVAVGTGSRTAAAVLFLLILASPRVFGSWRTRVSAVVVVAALAPLAVSMPAVQDRFFFGGSGGTVQDVLTLAPNVDTAGRRDLWPILIGYCEDRALAGYGIGASYELSRRASGGPVVHPHNDYIRTFCDTGVVGSVGVWGFTVGAAFQNTRRLRSRRRDRLATSAALAVVALLLLALSDNVLVYTAHFMLPVFVLLGWADQMNEAAGASFVNRRLPLAVRGRGHSGGA